MNPQPDFDSWLELALFSHVPMPDPSHPAGRLAREFFANSWANAQPLLKATRRLELQPSSNDPPRTFRFKLDLPYYRKFGDNDPVELAEGPLTGSLAYNPDVFPSGEALAPAVLVTIERELGFFHPNHARQFGYLCLGDVPRALELKALILLVYAVANYSNLGFDHPADREAARYFREHPEALEALLPATPLFETAL